MPLNEPSYDTSFDVVTPQPEQKTKLTIRDFVIFLGILAALAPLIAQQS